MNKKHQILDLPLPSDALKPCNLPDYKGWSKNQPSKGHVAMIFDTETSGLSASTNTILQLSWQVIDTTTWNILSKQNFYFEWPLNKERVSCKAIAVNGLTQKHLKKMGTSPLLHALYIMYQDMKGCNLLVGHNISFDLNFLSSTIQVLDLNSNQDFLKEFLKEIDKIDSYCTMRNNISFCHIINNHPFNNSQYKWPKLSELADRLSVTYADLQLHDSSEDVELTARCFKKLIEIGRIKPKNYD